jgi:hypothetical protein
MKLKCEDESRSLHCAVGARVRERKKKPAAPVGMTGLDFGALEKK